MDYPIVIAAFGTTSRARATYAVVDTRLKTRFPENEIYWAYSSRIVRHKLSQNDIELPSPPMVLNKIAAIGHKWAVVQSFNMICGHEFDRLKDEVLNGPVRVSIGHSLLCGSNDFMAVSKAMAPVFAKDPDEAVVLIGHGTDHYSWSVYPAFEHLLKQQYGNRAFVGVVEGDWPTREDTINQVTTAGFKHVRLVPFMLVAGMHFKEDLAGPEDSWKVAFEDRKIAVSLELDAIGSYPGIIDIFGDHIESAMDVIPRN
jgi:sirohydrochlorin cobaltochelatase